MTQEKKQLLLKDLCGRLPYGVIINYANDDALKNLDKKSGKLIQIQREDSENVFVSTEEVSYIEIEWLRPYLRPMSSMTDDERKYLLEEFGFDEDLENVEPNDFGSYVYRSVNVLPLFDWLNSHHFDYRGLIEKGLALEAPEGMYA